MEGCVCVCVCGRQGGKEGGTEKEGETEDTHTPFHRLYCTEEDQTLRRCWIPRCQTLRRARSKCKWQAPKGPCDLSSHRYQSYCMWFLIPCNCCQARAFRSGHLEAKYQVIIWRNVEVKIRLFFTAMLCVAFLLKEKALSIIQPYV